MWEKKFRRGFFCYLYLNLFWSIAGVEKEFNSAEIESLSQDFEKLDFQELQSKLAEFKNDYVESSTLLKNYIDLDKTHLIIKTILFVFLLEKKSLQEPSKLISDYLRITQDFAGSAAVSLVHAVLHKLVFNQEKPETA
jgi:transcription termination factor NusB